MGKRIGWFDLSLQFLLFSALSITCTAVGSSFLSIDCGGTGPYTDIYGIDWVPDDAYIQTGEKADVEIAYPANDPFKHSRIFPNGRRKNCYVLPQAVGVTYLLRVVLLHGGVAAIPFPVDFSVAVNSNIWFTWTLSASSTLINTPMVFESIFFSTAKEVYLCLLKGTTSIPYISSISMRELNPLTYILAKSGKILYNLHRLNNGPNPNITRFPDDDFDRFWFPALGMDYLYLVNTSKVVPNNPASNLVGFNLPATKVMMDAWTAPLISNIYTFSSFVEMVYVVLYFQELRSNYSADHPRGVVITVGDNIPLEFNISDLPSEVYFDSYNVSSTEVNITIEKQKWSSFNPILNAMETYSFFDVNLSAIDQGEVSPLQSVQASFNLTDWTGDPCYPVPWDWIVCDPDLSTVIAMNLSRMSIAGEIPSEISGLHSLEELYLDNNKLTGSIPTSMVSGLQRLRILKLDNNSLSGYIPLVFQNRTGFTFSGNSELSLCLRGDSCGVTPKSKKSSSNIGIIIGAVAGTILAIGVALGLIICCCQKYRKKSVSTAARPLQADISPPKYVQNSDEFLNSTEWPIVHSVEFKNSSPELIGAGVSTGYLPAGFISIDKVVAATQNFARKIGEGGYGPVFYGKLNGKEVAVKVNKVGAQQGRDEFINEVTLLARVHHRNLVSLLCFCEQGDERMLIYEYQSNGTLSDLLYGPNAAARPLDWKTRLDIAHNAAKGLEYLHTGCSPRIIHRDVKSNNILIDEKFVAKVADFGISKSTPDANTITDISTNRAFSTKIRGTVGYLDPEYFKTHKLSQKSDVYSFGVVLMETMAGTRPIVRGENGTDRFIVDQVKRAIETGDILSIADPALGYKFCPDSLWKVADLAWSSVDQKGANRPDMTQIVRGLGEALDMEMAYDPAGSATATRSLTMTGRSTSSRGSV